MKNNWFLILWLLMAWSGLASATSSQDLNAVALMSAQDLASGGASNLNVKNNTGATLTVYGVYLYGVAVITPGLTCAAADQTNSHVDAFMHGTAMVPIQFAVGQSIAIGQNYLYNMLYNWIYWYRSIGGSTACALPGCTWSTDSQPVTWCLKVGTVSSGASYTHTPYLAKAPPFSWATAMAILDYDYSYDLIPNTSDYVWLGPFTCNDKTLTCVMPNSQTQSFQS